MRVKNLLALLLALLMLLALLPASALAEEAGTIQPAEEIPEEEIPAEEPEGAEPPAPPQTLNYGYYLIGRYGWTVDDLVESRDKFETNYASSVEEYKLITELEEGQELKVVLVSNGTQLGPWFPDPGNNYVVDDAHSGKKIIYFRPQYNEEWAAFGGHIFITEPPTYHVNITQPANGMLIADKYDAQEGESVSITAVPNAGYYPNFIRSNDYPPNFRNPDAFNASFNMPANDVTVYMWTNKMSAEPGYYLCSGKGIDEVGPSDKFQEQETIYGDLVFEATLVEGNVLSLARFLVEQENGFISNGRSITNPDITAETAGHVKIFLSRTEREGYTKAFELLQDVQNTEDMWMTVKYFQPITVLPSEHGTVSAPKDAFPGDTVTLGVNPEDGYELDTLAVTDENGQPLEMYANSFVMPEGPVTVTATFKEAVMYTVTLVGAGEGVTITATKTEARVGENVDVNIITASGHSFVSITVLDEEGNEIPTSKRPDGANKYRFVMPASNVTVTVVTRTFYPLWVGSLQVTGDNCGNILGDGKVSYDPATRTLSFADPDPVITGNYGGALINYTGEDDFTIDAPRGLHLTAGESTGVTHALYAYGADVTINGDVALDMDGNGLWTTVSKLTVNGDVTGWTKAFALYGGGGVTVNGSVNVTNQEDIRVIFSNGAAEITGDFTGVGYGVDARQGVTVGGDVTVTGSVSTTNYGLQSAAGPIEVGGDFSFDGKAAYAAYADQSFTCGGSVTVENTSGKGIFSANGLINVNGGVWDVTAFSEPLKAKEGIQIAEPLEILLPAGGQVTLLNGFYVVTEADLETPADHVIITPPAPEGPATVIGKSLSLKGRIELNFYLTLPREVLMDRDAYVTINGEKLPVKDAPYTEVRGESGYRFTVGVKFSQLTEDRVLRLYNGAGEPLELRDAEDSDLTETGFVYCAQDYIETVRKTSEDEKLLAVVNALSDLGSLAQAQFDYNTDSRVELVGELSSVTADTVAAFAPVLETGEASGVRYYGSSLLLKDITTLRHYFTVPGGDLSGYTFTVDGTEVTPVQRGSFYCIDILGIVARDLDRSFRVEVVGPDGAALTLEGSAMSYAWTQLSRGEESTLTELTRAVVLYSLAANEFFTD